MIQQGFEAPKFQRLQLVHLYELVFRMLKALVFKSKRVTFCTAAHFTPSYAVQTLVRNDGFPPAVGDRIATYGALNG